MDRQSAWQTFACKRQSEWDDADAYGDAAYEAQMRDADPSVAQPEPPRFKVGDRVQRIRGDQKPGVIVGLLPNRMYPEAKPSARVQFVDRTRLGGSGYHHSTIALKALKHAEEN